MALLTREEILAIDDLTPTITRVPGPAGQGEVGVRMMTAGEREDFLDLITEHGGEVKRLKPMLCALTLCDDRAGRLFSLQEVEVLASKSTTFIDDVFAVAKRINNMDQDAVEDTKKNSAPIPDAASSSDSAAPSGDTAPAPGDNASLLPS